MSFLQKKAIPQTTFILHSLSLFLKSNNDESDPRYPDWLELQLDRLFPGFSIHHRAVQEILDHSVADKRAKIIPLRLCSEGGAYASGQRSGAPDRSTRPNKQSERGALMAKRAKTERKKFVIRFDAQGKASIEYLEPDFDPSCMKVGSAIRAVATKDLSYLPSKG